MINFLDENVIKSISSKVGGDYNSTKNIATEILPIILGGLKNNAKDNKKSKLLEKAIDKKHDGTILKNLDNINLDDGDKILGHIFGSKKDEVLKGSNNSDIMKALTPIVMGMLGKAKKSSGMNVSDLLKGDSSIMDLAKNLIDTDGNGDIKDNLLSMAMKFFKK